MSAYYSKRLVEKLPQYAERIKSKIYTEISKLETEVFVTPEPVSFLEREQGTKLKLETGDIWGKVFDCGWFHFWGEVPKEYLAEDIVVLIDVSGEGLVVDDEGHPVQGLTCVVNENEPFLAMSGKKVFRPNIKNGKIDFWMDAGNNDLFGVYKGGKLIKSDIAVFDPLAHKLFFDFVILLDLLNSIPHSSARYYSVLYALSDAGALVSDWTEGNVKKAIELLKVELSKKNGDQSLEFFATGHAHIDLAWLWPIRETKRKSVRSFATALHNLEKYPSYIFGQSQSQLYDWVKSEYPKLYKNIKQKITEGRIEPQGAMWVEADTNVPCGESLVRQILYGKRFFKEEFGKDQKIAHMPDTFGFTAALPQILKKSGVDYLLTIKLSWSLFNKFPYHTFHWIGQDGSKVLVHMPPENNYNSNASPSAIKRATDNFTEKGRSKVAQILYGIGDGGGGPGEEHLEGMSRIANLEGISPVRQAKTSEFFEVIEKEKDKFFSYKGEMYLEAHQGTYTSQAKNKYYNRLLEKLLRDAEMLCALATLYSGAPYPKEEIERIYKEVLLYQFHDILPGSSIKRVHDESVERYICLEQEVRDIISKVVSGGKRREYFNTLSWQREELVKEEGKWHKIVIPALGSGVPTLENEMKSFGVMHIENSLSNGKITAVFGDKGNIISLKSGEFEAINSEANVLNIYCDNENAWDIDHDYIKKPVRRAEFLGAKTFVDGPYVIREQRFSFGSSQFLQIIKLKDNSEYLEIENIVDWQESQKMFRIDGNFNITSDYVICDIQFGNINRSTLENNSIEFAQFEVCAHKYVDLTDGAAGVAILNDCKYGFRAKDNFISINALRSTSNPGKDADRGEHKFKYALYPYTANRNTERLSYEFNYPLVETSKSIPSLLNVENKNIIVETIKRSEDGKSTIIRLYNNSKAKQVSEIAFCYDFKEIHLTDLLENKLQKQKISDGKIILEFKPYEIHTLCLE